MTKVGMNFLTEPARAGGEGRRMYTRVFDMPTVPRAFETISDVSLGSEDLAILPGTVTKVTWTYAIDDWVAYIDVQTTVGYDDHSHDPRS